MIDIQLQWAETYRKMNELPWIAILGHERWDMPMKSLANRIKSDPKSLFTVMNVLVYLLHALLCHEHILLLKGIIDHWFRHCRQGGSFSDFALWRHQSWSFTSRECGYWHYDVIFIDDSCTRKLARRRSLLWNKNREYRFFTTRYSRLSVHECLFLDFSVVWWYILIVQIIQDLVAQCMILRRD